MNLLLRDLTMMKMPLIVGGDDERHFFSLTVMIATVGGNGVEVFPISDDGDYRMYRCEV
jgi:hypothetical protein